MADKLLKNIDLNGHSYEIDAKYLGGKTISDIENYVKITYDELKSLRDSSKLIPGKQYRITDYITSTSQENTKSAGHQFDIIVTADDVNRLNEKARSIQHEGDTYFANSDLNAWQIWYCLDNDTNRFAWASNATKDTIKDYQIGKICGSSDTTAAGTYTFTTPIKYIFHRGKTIQLEIGTKVSVHEGPPVYATLNTNYEILIEDSATGYTSVYPIYVYTDPYVEYSGRGVIYRMVDEFGNDCPYDFKNIMFNRYKLDKPDDSNISITSYQYSLRNIIYETYNSYNQLSHVKMSYLWSGISDTGKYWDLDDFLLSSNVNTNENKYFFTFSKIISNDTFDNSLNKNCKGNIIKEHKGTTAIIYLNNNVFFSSSDGECSNNIFGYNCHNNSFDDECTSNTFKDDCHQNVFGTTCCNNIFGNGCYLNIFGNRFQNNTFNNTCINNGFHYECRYNSFGNGCKCNGFGISCDNTSFGNECYNNIIHNYSNNNTFDNGCSNNDLGTYCQANVFKAGCNYNNISSEGANNTFGANCHRNIIKNESSYNSFGNMCYDIIIKDGYYNSFGNGCRDITLSESCSGNSFGNVCGDITLSESCSGNSFGNECNGITLNNSYMSYNTFGDNVKSLVLTNTSTASSSQQVQYYRFATGLAVVGTITAIRGRSYETYVGKNSSGGIKQICLLDLD